MPATAERDAAVGGQAVLEGVMMRGVSTWAVASRLPDGEIGDRSRSPDRRLDAAAGSCSGCPCCAAWPRWRSRCRSASSALERSANAQQARGGQEISSGAWAGTVVVALVFAIGLFFVVPVGLTSLIKDQLGSPRAVLAGRGPACAPRSSSATCCCSRARSDLRRVFEYHGAEHKVIACYEAGDAADAAERAQRFSRLHPRCGTSFLLVVMVVSIFVFAPVGLPAWYLLLATRILGVPLIAGLSFELIKFAGRNRAALGRS